jgi:hypothetical protein
VAGTTQSYGLEDLIGAATNPRRTASPFSAGEERRDRNIFAAGQMIEEVVGLKDVAHNPIAKVAEIRIIEGTKRVVLPEPDRPRIDTKEWASIVRSMPDRTSMSAPG